MPKNPFPSWNWYPKDWLTSEARASMTLEQRAAYRDLLDQAWLGDPPCSLPDDDVILAAMVGMTLERWQKSAPLIRQWFVTKRGRLVNEKQMKVFREAVALRKKKSEGGKKSAELRAKHAQESSKTPPKTLPTEWQPPTPTPTPTPIEEKEGKKIPPATPSAQGHLWKAAESLIGDGAGPFLGKLAKDHGQPALIRAIGALVAAQPPNPRGYLMEVIRSNDNGSHGRRTPSGQRALTATAGGTREGWGDEPGNPAETPRRGG